VHLNTGQYASAFHYFSSSINLKPTFASSYMYLAITLSRLDDFENACSAYEKESIRRFDCAPSYAAVLMCCPLRRRLGWRKIMSSNSITQWLCTTTVAQRFSLSSGEGSIDRQGMALRRSAGCLIRMAQP